MEQVRLDKWLWAARFFKTRALAADAIDIGRVDVNEERVKRAKLVRVGDIVRVRRPPFEQVVVVQGLSEQRGPAAVAQTLYDETSASRAARERVAAQIRAAGSVAGADAGRPDKRDRRAINRWRGRDT
ncbi:MAG: RNA-binding S4 domain-containing protein [Gemmatimonadaceae bacterium]